MRIRRARNWKTPPGLELPAACTGSMASGLDAEAIPFADSSALEVLETFKAALEARGARLIIASAHGRFLQAIQRSGLADGLSPDGLHSNLDAAVAAAARQTSDAPA